MNYFFFGSYLLWGRILIEDVLGLFGYVPPDIENYHRHWEVLVYLILGIPTGIAIGASSWELALLSVVILHFTYGLFDFIQKRHPRWRRIKQVGWPVSHLSWVTVNTILVSLLIRWIN